MEQRGTAMDPRSADMAVDSPGAKRGTAKDPGSAYISVNAPSARRGTAMDPRYANMAVNTASAWNVSRSMRQSRGGWYVLSARLSRLVARSVAVALRRCLMIPTAMSRLSSAVHSSNYSPASNSTKGCYSVAPAVRHRLATSVGGRRRRRRILIFI